MLVDLILSSLPRLVHWMSLLGPWHLMVFCSPPSDCAYPLSFLWLILTCLLIVMILTCWWNFGMCFSTQKTKSYLIFLLFLCWLCTCSMWCFLTCLPFAFKTLTCSSRAATCACCCSCCSTCCYFAPLSRYP